MKSPIFLLILYAWTINIDKVLSKPTEINVEPTEINVEPTEINVEPTEINVEPTEINVEPTSSTTDTSEYYGDLSMETLQKIQKCDRDMNVMELCMRCAKVTKSSIVYPMCCDDEDNVGKWCKEYVYYGM